MSKRPNFLILFPDQHRGDWMPYNKETFQKFGMTELPLRMPNIKRIMKAGVIGRYDLLAWRPIEGPRF
ncbi:MAG: hypothetical protein ACTSP6_09100 [Promethearchaeota archaeon]